MTKLDRLSVRIPERDNALLDLAIVRMKLDTGRAISKNDVFRFLVKGFLDGRFQLDAFEGIDVKAIADSEGRTG